MKILTFLTLISLFGGLMACTNDDTPNPVPEPVSEKVVNLHAPQEGGQGEPISGAFTKFNFADKQITTSETEWDIAFRGTTIIVNGGVSAGAVDEPERTGNAAAYIAEGTLAGIDAVETERLVQDNASGYAIPAGSGNGWYSYASAPTHLISPIPGRVLVFRTHDGKYAKVEILSYYKDAPDNPDAFVNEDSYYTFNYVYQPKEDITTF